MKKCVWCSRTEEETEFQKKAHTVPQSLGGKQICLNVCDSCNHFFGSHYQGMPAVEVALKEAFNITRGRLLAALGEIGRNKTLSRPTSEYFNFTDFSKNKISIKPKYSLRKGFQQNLCRQFKKGIYKVFLEEIERQTGEGLNSKYDFIRHFVRRNIGDFPVVYFERTYGIIPILESWVKNPELVIDEDLQFKYLVREPGFFEFDLLGHVFGVATTMHWEIVFDAYIESSSKAKVGIFKSWKLIRSFNDIDLALRIINK